jgi:cytosine deaminase
LDSLDLITVNSAKALGLERSYGISVGKTADLVVTDAFSELELIRTMYPRLLVMKVGKVISKSTPHSTTIFRDGKEKKFNYHL